MGSRCVEAEVEPSVSQPDAPTRSQFSAGLRTLSEALRERCLRPSRKFSKPLPGDGSLVPPPRRVRRQRAFLSAPALKEEVAAAVRSDAPDAARRMRSILWQRIARLRRDLMAEAARAQRRVDEDKNVGGRVPRVCGAQPHARSPRRSPSGSC